MPVSIAIRGAGVAGLSLAHALRNALPHASISLFDIRPRLPHPSRTFCFFDDGVPPLPVTPDHRWSRVAFRGEEISRHLQCSSTPYTMIRGDTFFQGMLAHLEERGVLFTWECDSVVVTEGALIVDGERRRHDLVIDAAFSGQEVQPILWQSFGGLWIEAEQDLFDPQEALLMDLDGSTEEAPVRFVYLLPTSARTALIEHTTFSRSVYPPENHFAECERWASARGLSQFTITEREHGAIPMGLPTEDSSGIRVGSGGGALRGSTGYAFASIQRQVHTLTTQVAQRIDAAQPPPTRAPRPFPAWMEFGDTLFLRTLARLPERGTVLMEQLLSRAPERELISFLSGQAGLLSALRVMACLPKVTMIRGLCGG